MSLSTSISTTTPSFLLTPTHHPITPRSPFLSYFLREPQSLEFLRHPSKSFFNCSRSLSFLTSPSSVATTLSLSFFPFIFSTIPNIFGMPTLYLTSSSTPIHSLSYIALHARQFFFSFGSKTLKPRSPFGSTEEEKKVFPPTILSP